MLKPLSSPISKLNTTLFERKFVALGRLLEYWDVIAGKDLAKVSRPVKLKFRKGKKESGKGLRNVSEAVLEIATDSSNAMLFTYRKDLVLEKINQIIGTTAVSDILIRHQKIETINPVTDAETPNVLDKAREQKLADTLAGVSDPEIKERLMKLGTYVYQYSDITHSNQKQDNS